MAAIEMVVQLEEQGGRDTLNRVLRDWQSAARSRLIGLAGLKALYCHLEGSVDMISGGWHMAMVEGSGSGNSW